MRRTANSVTAVPDTEETITVTENTEQDAVTGDEGVFEQAADEAPAEGGKPGRKVSPLLAATRAYEAASATAGKARAAAEKIAAIMAKHKVLADGLAEAEELERAAWADLQALLGKLSGPTGS